jgi:hypothetical protein
MTTHTGHIPVVGQKKKKTTARFTKFLVQAHLTGESSKASIETWRSVGSDFVLPCPQFELLIFGSSVLGGQDGVSEAMLVSKQAATLEVALISTDTTP